MGEAGRLPYGEGRGDAIRVRLEWSGSKLVSSPSSRPDIRRLPRGRKLEEEAWAELVRTLLALIANYAASQGVGHMVGCRARDNTVGRLEAAPITGALRSVGRRHGEWRMWSLNERRVGRVRRRVLWHVVGSYGIDTALELQRHGSERGPVRSAPAFEPRTQSSPLQQPHFMLCHHDECTRTASTDEDLPSCYLEYHGVRAACCCVSKQSTVLARMAAHSDSFDETCLLGGEQQSWRGRAASSTHRDQ